MEKHKVPALRFKDFTQDWEQRKLGELVSFAKGHGYSKSSLVDEGVPIVLYGRLYTAYETIIKTLDTRAMPLENSVYSIGGEVVVPASGETADDIAIASVVENAGVLLGGDLNILYPSKNINPKFLAINITSGKPHYDIAKKAQGKSVVHVHNDDLAKVNIQYPNIKEQEQISNFQLMITNLITLHQRKLEKLKKIKKSMLEKMFPKNNKKIPEIRFSAFFNDWEQRKLGECFSERIETMPDGELISVTINNGVKKFSELGRFDNSNPDKSKYKKVCLGDIAYNSMRMWQGASGYSPYTGIVSPAYTVLVPNECVDSKFVSYLFKRKDILNIFQINSQGITSDNWNLKYPVLSKIKIKIPDEIKEQKFIACCFMEIDNLITLHQRKILALIFFIIATW